MKLLTWINYAVTTYLPAWIVVFAFIAYLVPWWFEPLTNWTGFMLGLILFLMGMTIPPSSIRYVFRHPKLVFTGVCLSGLLQCYYQSD